MTNLQQSLKSYRIEKDEDAAHFDDVYLASDETSIAPSRAIDRLIFCKHHMKDI